MLCDTRDDSSTLLNNFLINKLHEIYYETMIEEHRIFVQTR